MAGEVNKKDLNLYVLFARRRMAEKTKNSVCRKIYSIKMGVKSVLNYCSFNVHKDFCVMINYA